MHISTNSQCSFLNLEDITVSFSFFYALLQQFTFNKFKEGLTPNENELIIYVFFKEHFPFPLQLPI